MIVQSYLAKTITAYLLRRVALKVNHISTTQVMMQRYTKDTQLLNNNSKIYLNTVEIKQKKRKTQRQT